MNAPSLIKYLPLCLLVLGARAEDFTLADGTVLKDAEVLRQSSEEVQIRHAGGIEKFSYTELSPELQQRFEMTPAQVDARKNAAREAAENKRIAREQAKAERERALKEAQAAREAALQAAGKYPRYVNGAEVIRLCSAFLTLDARVAEFLAAEWNRREALRMELPADAERFASDAAALRKDFEQDRAALAASKAEVEKLRTQTQAQRAELQRKDAEIAALRAQVAELNKELGRAEAQSDNSSSGTVVIDRPVYVPTYVPSPVIVPGCGRRGHPSHHTRPHRPTPARPGGHIPPPRLANSAHTIPRR